MADHRKLIPILLKWEGGYCGNIDGKICTMKGVTLETYRMFYGNDKTCEDLRRISDEEWSHIFKLGYWDKWRADEIDDQEIANLLVDWTYNSGAIAIRYAQAVLGVSTDGKVGPKTLAAINCHPNRRELFKRLYERRKRHYETIAAKNPSKRKFLRGWLNRLSAFKHS